MESCQPRSTEHGESEREGGTNIDLPQLIERGVVEGSDGSIHNEDETAACGKHTRQVRVQQVKIFLDLLGYRIGGEFMMQYD